MLERPGRESADNAPPLVVDVDGTLLAGDLLWESFWAALSAEPAGALRLALRHRRTPARLKRRLLDLAEPDAAGLALNADVLALIGAARQAGRPVVLCSGSDQRLVDALAARLDLPGPHLGSDGATNLVGPAKAAALVQRFGAGGFDYAGNERRDLPIWAAARQGYAVAPGPRLAHEIGALDTPVQLLGGHGTGWAALWSALRPHQWVKNLLLLLPLLAAHAFEAERLLPVLVMVAAFSAAASSIYLINDLFDIDADRRHPEKRHRPIASGALPIPAAMRGAAALAVAALAASAAVGPVTLILIACYLTLSVAYSAWAKRRRWIDLCALVGLYGLRIGAGAAAAGVGLSPWLWAFLGAVFLALTAVKRLTGLSRTGTAGHLPGRDYGADERPAVIRIALLSAAAAALLWLVYSLGPEAAALYRQPRFLQLASVAVAVWLVRMIRLSAAGREDYDPVRFIEHDRTGLLIVAVGLALAVAAH